MENTPRLTRRKVNKLVRKAFGFGFRGDFFWRWGGNYNIGDFNSKGKDFNGDYGLGLIARRWPTVALIMPAILPLYLVSERFRESFGLLEERGEFLNQDGSELRVKEKFISQAERYSKLYERETGEKVRIRTYS